MHKDGIRGRVSRCGERGGGLGLHIDQYERDNLNTLAMECISDASEHEGEDCLHAETTS